MTSQADAEFLNEGMEKWIMGRDSPIPLTVLEFLVFNVINGAF